MDEDFLAALRRELRLYKGLAVPSDERPPLRAQPRAKGGPSAGQSRAHESREQATKEARVDHVVRVMRFKRGLIGGSAGDHIQDALPLPLIVRLAMLNLHLESSLECRRRHVLLTLVLVGVVTLVARSEAICDTCGAAVWKACVHVVLEIMIVQVICVVCSRKLEGHAHLVAAPDSAEGDSLAINHADHPLCELQRTVKRSVRRVECEILRRFPEALCKLRTRHVGRS